jgi:5-bromo-4-chloroindolyl phosphate hydrolysis protein
MGMKKNLTEKDIKLMRHSLLETEKNLLKRLEGKSISIQVFKLQQKYLEEVRTILNKEEDRLRRIQHAV